MNDRDAWQRFVEQRAQALSGAERADDEREVDGHEAEGSPFALERERAIERQRRAAGGAGALTDDPYRNRRIGARKRALDASRVVPGSAEWERVLGLPDEDYQRWLADQRRARRRPPRERRKRTPNAARSRSQAQRDRYAAETPEERRRRTEWFRRLRRIRALEARGIEEGSVQWELLVAMPYAAWQRWMRERSPSKRAQVLSPTEKRELLRNLEFYNDAELVFSHCVGTYPDGGITGASISARDLPIDEPERWLREVLDEPYEFGSRRLLKDDEAPIEEMVNETRAKETRLEVERRRWRWRERYRQIKAMRDMAAITPLLTRRHP